MARAALQSKKARALTFKRRMTSVKKKAVELTTLCGIEACMICFGPDGQLHTWPDNIASVNSTINKYRSDISSESSSSSVSSKKDEDEIVGWTRKIEMAKRAIAEAERENSAKLLRLMMDTGREEAPASRL